MPGLRGVAGGGVRAGVSPDINEQAAAAAS